MNSLAEKIADLLTDAQRLDQDAIDAICRIRVDCNQALAGHQSIIVSGTITDPTIGIIGLLNGLLPDESRVAAVVDTVTGRVTGFQVVSKAAPIKE